MISHVLSPMHFDFHFILNFAELSPTQKLPPPPWCLARASSWYIAVPPSAMTWVSLMLPYRSWLVVTGRRQNLRQGAWVKMVCYGKYSGSHQSTMAVPCIIAKPLLGRGKCLVQIESIITVEGYIRIYNYQQCISIHILIPKQIPFLNETSVRMELSPYSCRKLHAVLRRVFLSAQGELSCRVPLPSARSACAHPSSTEIIISPTDISEILKINVL